MGNDGTKEKRAPVSQKLSQRRFWVSTIVFVAGVLSISMLIFTDQISERERQGFALNDAVMDMRFRVAAFHLWLEEAITGDEEVDIKNVWFDIDQAIHLSEAMLKGGANENGVILKPVEDSKRRTQVENLKSLLTRLKSIGLQRHKDVAAAGIRSALDQSFDALYKQIESNALALENVLEREQVQEQIKSRRLFWGILFAWACVIVGGTADLRSRERRRKAAEKILEQANEELKNFREHLMELVETRTMDLITANKHLEKEVTERQEVELILRESGKQLRHLSSELITIQEQERGRISQELHDELGGGMAALKFSVNFIKKKLREDQINLSEECGKTIQYIDQIIDNVHRLSWDLSPSVLEDLGLSKALRWMVNYVTQRGDIKVTLDIEDADYPFSPHIRITIYRIFQEAFTNIVRHAQAKNVWMAIKNDTDGISFSVEDDGKGFDLINTDSKNPAGKGLTGMYDRAQMLGGTFKVWSQEGKGTRITLQIPIEKNAGVYTTT